MPRTNGPPPTGLLPELWDRGGAQHAHNVPSTSGRDSAFTVGTGFPQSAGKEYRPLPQLSQAQLHDLQRFKNQVGQELQRLRSEQLKNGIREYYTMDHYQRLLQFEARNDYTGSKCDVYCKDVHVPGCKECKTCHFCRQKTIDIKTWCPCSQNARVPFGGKGRGYWCGACLQIRMGQNINEVHRIENWRCPCCLGICNCSGATCLRAKKGLYPTQQLIHEAERMRYKSVAHYLVLTHISEHARAMPMEDVSDAAWRKRPAAETSTNPVHKRARMAFGEQQREVQARIVASTARLTAQVALEFPPPALGSDDPVQGQVALQMEAWKALESAGNDSDDDEGPEQPVHHRRPAPPSAIAARAASTTPYVEPGYRAEQPADVEEQLNESACLANLSEALGLRMPRGQRSQPVAMHAAAGSSRPPTGVALQPAASADAPAASRQPFDGPHPGLDAEEGDININLGRQRWPSIRRQGAVDLHGQVQAERPSSAHPFDRHLSSAATSDGAQPGFQGGVVGHSGQHSRPVSAPTGSAGTGCMSPTGTNLSGANAAQPPKLQEDIGDCALESQGLTIDTQHHQSLPPAASADAFAHSGHPPAIQAAAHQPGIGNDEDPPGSRAAYESLQDRTLTGCERSEFNPAAIGPEDGRAAEPALQPVPDFAADGPHSNGGVSRLLREAQYLYLYPAGSEEHQECMKRIEMGLEDLKGDLLEAVYISEFNRPTDDLPCDPEQRREHAPTDHASLKDAVAFLLIAADALSGTLDQADIIRLLFNQEPFVDFSRCDPRARAILLRAAFSLYNNMASRGLQAAAVVEGILGFIDCLSQEYEELNIHLLSLQSNEVCLGPIKLDAAAGLQQKEVTVTTVMHGNVELLKIALQHVQSACTGLPDGSEDFLAPQLLSMLDGSRHVNGYVRYGVCHVLTTALTAVEPRLRHQVAKEELLMKQRAVGSRLARAMPLLDAMVSATYSMRQQRREATAFSLEETTMYHIVAIDQIKVPLLARIHGLLVEANLRRWQELESAAVRPFALTTLWKHANTVYRHLALTYIAVGLQSAPGGAHRACNNPDNGVISLLKVWLQSAFDEGRRHPIFAFFTQVLADNPHTSELLAGVNREHIQCANHDDRTGEARAAVVYHALSRLMTWRAGGESLLQGLDEAVTAQGAQMYDEGRRRRWEAATCRLLLAICHAGVGIPFAGQPPGRGSRGAVDRASAITHLLKMLATWMPRTASWRQRMRKPVAPTEYGPFEEAPPTVEQIQEERLALKVTCLRHLGDVLHLLAALAGDFPASLERSPLLSCLRLTLSVGLEVPTGSYLASAEDAPKVGEGNVVDVALVELSAEALTSALVPDSLHFLHYVLGTHMPHMLARALQGGSQRERAGVNALRLLDELFKHHSLRQSQERLQLLLPPLMSPLLEALHPKQEFWTSLGVKEAVYACFAGLLEVNGELLVPPSASFAELSQAVNAVARPQQLWRSDMQTATRIADERYNVALQLMLHSLCAGVSRCLEAFTPEASTADQAIVGQEAEAAKGMLVKLLGQPRILTATEQLYHESLPSDASAGAPPGPFRAVDFKRVLAERSLSFLAALARAGPHGPDWALPALTNAVRNLTYPTLGLRVRFNEVLGALRTAGRMVSHLELAEPLSILHMQGARANVRADDVDMGSLRLNGQGASTQPGVPQPSVASYTPTGNTSPVVLQSQTTMRQPSSFKMQADGVPYSCFVKLQKMDIVDHLSGFIIKRKVSETGTFFTVELQEGGRGQSHAEKTVSALIYWPYTVSSVEARSGKELEADLNKHHSGGVGQWLSCKRLRYNGRVKNNPRKHLFVALHASTYCLLTLLETASGRRQEQLRLLEQHGAHQGSQLSKPTQLWSLPATLPAVAPIASTQPNNSPSMRTHQQSVPGQEGSNGIVASQASSGGTADRSSSGQAPRIGRFAQTSMRHLYALLEMGFTDTAANQEALMRVEREGIKEQERQVSRAVEFLSASI